MGWIEGIDGLAQNAFVQAVIINQVPVPVVAGFLEPAKRTDILIVAAPEGEAGVVTQAAHLVFGFLADLFEEGGCGGIQRTGKHEIVP